MKIFAWNVNGIRSVAKKGFVDWFKAAKPDVLCLQETRATLEQLPDDVREVFGGNLVWANAEKKGYSGVATWSRTPADRAEIGLGKDEFDREGRIVITHHGDLAIINGYFPNGQRDHARVPYKLTFYEAVLDKAKALAAEGHQIIVTGDMNTAFAAIDLARPKQNTKTSGCLPQEREALGAFYEAGFVDAFRTLQPDTEGVYSWWSNRSGARARNIGWRIDYHLVSTALLDRTKAARIHTEVMGSDHCPIELELTPGGAT